MSKISASTVARGADRADRIFEPEGVGQRFHLVTLQGTEAACELFRFDLVARLAGKAGAPLEEVARQLLGRPVTFGFGSKHGRRLFHGVIVRSVSTLDGELHVTVVPWLWLLTRVVDSRVFVNQSVLDIVEQLFREHGCKDFRLDVRRADYPKLERCVQYRESVAQFVARLLERAGVYTYWEHGEGVHTLVLADGSVPAKPCRGGPFKLRRRRGAGEVCREPEVFSWEQCNYLTPTRVTVDDYDHRAPRTSRQASAKVEKPSGAGDLEVYLPAAGHRTRAEGERIARLRLEQEEAVGVVISGAGAVPTFAVGQSVAVEGVTGGPFLVTRVVHDLSRPGRGERGGYENDFQCVPLARPYRPPCVTPVPVVAGYQTAVVVDADGKDVPGENPVFTDEFGRVKVRIHGDRPRPGQADTSNWVRVAHAGGQMRLPRVGEEVFFICEHGDPDRPLVIDSGYPTAKDGHFHPAKRPLRHAIRGPFASDPKAFNEVRLDASPGREHLALAAGRDAELTAARDLVEEVGGDRFAFIDGALVEQTGNGRWTEVTKAWLVKVIGSMAVEVTKRLVLESSDTIHIKAKEVIVEGSGSFFRAGPAGMEIVGSPLTQINCGGSAPPATPIDAGQPPARKRRKKDK
jgi:type VI secretion system secreted protein VgrG